MRVAEVRVGDKTLGKIRTRHGRLQVRRGFFAPRRQVLPCRALRDRNSVPLTAGKVVD
jgi:hypothetical protein